MSVTLSECQVTSQKSKAVAYLLWLTLGWFGAHHFYLGRWRHGFAYSWTFGFFGVGWLSDLWYMSQYLDDANGWDWIDQVDFSKPAPLSFVGVLAEFILGTIAGELMKRAFPGDWLRQAPWLACTSSLTVSTG